MEITRQAKLEAIAKELENLTEAPLYSYRTENKYLPVPGEGSPYASIMLIGEAPGEWVGRYLQEVTTRWTKPMADFTVSGEWAFGRYTYTASDSIIIRDPETEGGGTANDSGWGFVVYHHDADGAWRVARDGWGSDRPAR